MQLSFAITTYKDNSDLAISDLTRFYPGAYVFKFNDCVEHLKTPDQAGKWTERYLRAFLASDADILIKIDPDTAVLRPAVNFPTSDMFGECVLGFPLGGAIGYSRVGAQKIVDSNLLQDAKYTTKDYTYSWKGGEQVSCQDKIMRDIVNRLSLSVAVWNEVCVRMSHLDSTMPTKDYAFVHPDSRKGNHASN
jgi:hypothetical protein